MALTVSDLMQNLNTLYNRELRTIVQQKAFTLLFHDTTKLRIRLEDRDISVPISILLFGICQLLTEKEFSREMCKQILGKEWGYGIVARLLLECEDVCLKPGAPGLTLLRVKVERRRLAPVKPPPKEAVAVKQSNNHRK